MRVVASAAWFPSPDRPPSHLSHNSAILSPSAAPIFFANIESIKEFVRAQVVTSKKRREELVSSFVGAPLNLLLPLLLLSARQLACASALPSRVQAKAPRAPDPPMHRATDATGSCAARISFPCVPDKPSLVACTHSSHPPPSPPPPPSLQGDHIRFVVIDMSPVTDIDSSAMHFLGARVTGGGREVVARRLPPQPQLAVGCRGCSWRLHPLATHAPPTGHPFSPRLCVCYKTSAPCSHGLSAANRRLP